jgi:hypothetical protein
VLHAVLPQDLQVQPLLVGIEVFVWLVCYKFVLPLIPDFGNASPEIIFEVE